MTALRRERRKVPFPEFASRAPWHRRGLLRILLIKAVDWSEETSPSHLKTPESHANCLEFPPSRVQIPNLHERLRRTLARFPPERRSRNCRTNQLRPVLRVARDSRRHFVQTTFCTSQRRLQHRKSMSRVIFFCIWRLQMC